MYYMPKTAYLSSDQLDSLIMPSASQEIGLQTIKKLWKAEKQSFPNLL